MDKAAGQWIREERERRKWSREVLAQRAGVSMGTIARIESPQDDGKGINRSTVLHIGSGLELPTPISAALSDWMLGQITKRQFLDRLEKKSHGDGVNGNGHARRPGLPSPDIMATLGTDAIPIVGEVTAGGMVESIVYEPGDEYERVPFKVVGTDRVYAVRIIGDSMSPEYRSGEILILKDATPDELEDGEDAVVQCNGGADGVSTFKRVIMLGGGKIKLMPINTTFEPITCSLDHVARVGKVLGTYRPKASRKGK